jgi:hypothetical protein
VQESDNEDNSNEGILVVQVEEEIIEEIGPMNEDLVDPDMRHVATKNLKRKRVNAFSPDTEPVE